MSNVAFTIVSKNYLALANVLGDSIKKHNPQIDFYIIVADTEDNIIDFSSQKYKVISALNLGIKGLTDMAFKYDVTEFCTSIKPNGFSYLMDVLGYEKAIYFDPDILVFNSLQIIFDNDLEHKDIVLTPHYVTPEVNYTGEQPECLTLFVGIYNFGFLALKKTKNTKILLDWWTNRLEKQCYADKIEALHTDQKWGDFIPSFFSDSVMISKNLGYNLAPWNIHERKVIFDQNSNKPYVESTIKQVSTVPLFFVHFAGFDPNDEGVIHKNFISLTSNTYPYYQKLLSIYREETGKYSFADTKNITYSYDFFSNQVRIQPYHRRLYRSLTEYYSFSFKDPFNSEGELYRIFQKNNLIDESTITFKVNEKSFEGFDKNVKRLNKLMILLKFLIGTNKYFLLLKLLNRYSRIENQAFLIDELSDRYIFINENRSNTINLNKLNM